MQWKYIYQHFFASGVIKHWNMVKSSEIKVRSQKMFQNNINEYFTRAKTHVW